VLAASIFGLGVVTLALTYVMRCEGRGSDRWLLGLAGPSGGQVRLDRAAQFAGAIGPELTDGRSLDRASALIVERADGHSRVDHVCKKASVQRNRDKLDKPVDFVRGEVVRLSECGDDPSRDHARLFARKLADGRAPVPLPGVAGSLGDRFCGEAELLKKGDYRRHGLSGLKVDAKELAPSIDLDVFHVLLFF